MIFIPRMAKEKGFKAIAVSEYRRLFLFLRFVNEFVLNIVFNIKSTKNGVRR